MSLVDKDTNVLDNKKEAVVTMLFPEKKVLTTEKVTTSDGTLSRAMKDEMKDSRPSRGEPSPFSPPPTPKPSNTIRTGRGGIQTCI